MQVEYEDTPATFSTSALLGEQAQVEEGQSDEEDQEDEQDQDQEEEEEEEEEQTGKSDNSHVPTHSYWRSAENAEAQTEAGAKTKPKRIIKQRQSLSEKQTGTTIFPISRIKKICKADKDLDMMTSEATFMVSVATVS